MTMHRLVCTACGANDLVEDNGYYVCRYCGTRFLRQTAKAVSIDKQERLSNMLTRADLYWRHNNRRQALALYHQVLELDANCAVARERVGWR